ncbi:MAG: ParB/RepB/Spo0J family partition protein [Ruminococcaceae bacterium]|nr:ParB/RepB/Spo0J family partition protein [Oscillospiraceae bacterium]
MESYGKINPEAMSMFEILKKQGMVMSIALSDIVPNPAQPRRNFDESELFALGESIRENGLIQPISVRRIKSGFELIAGERRFRACKLIGRQKIEAIVYDIGDEDSAAWALIENLQRSDLGPFEEAEALFKLISGWNLPREEAAKRLGIASSTLSNKLRILKLEPEVRKIITENNLTERHARELLRIETEKGREEAAKFIAEKELNVPETVRYIDRILEREKPKKKKARYFVKDLRLFINTFEHAVEVMNSAGLGAVSSVSENEESLIYTVAVPKANAFKKAESSAG